MADTQRSVVAMLALLIVNGFKNTSVQIIRDFATSVVFRDGSQGFTDGRGKLGSINLTASSITELDPATWTEIAGTFSAGDYNDSEWTLAPSGAGLVWGGTSTVRVEVHAQCAFSGGGNGDALAIGVAVDSTIVGDHGHVTLDANGDSPATVHQLVQVAPGETVSLRIQNHTDGSDVTVAHLTGVVETHPVAS